jgi:hypothetical protein
MAKIQYSALVNSIDGKLAGTIFTHGPYGHYLKRATSPIKPETAKQNTIKCAFQNAAKSWRSLTAAQRLSWVHAAKSAIVRTILGSSINVSGFTLFMSACGQSHVLGVTNPTTPPLQSTLFRVTNASMAWGGAPSDMQLTFAPIIPATGAIALYMTAPCSIGIATPNKDWRLIKILTVVNFTPANCKAEYIAVFGAAPSSGSQAGWAVVGLPRVPRVGRHGVLQNCDISGTIVTP